MRNIFLAFIVGLAILSCKDENSQLGDTYFKNREYDKAIKAYNEYLKLEPAHVKTIYNRGRAYEELGKHELAIKDFNKVLEEDPRNVGAYLSLTSDFYYRQKDYENTVFYADKALGLEENSALAYTLKGKASQKLGNLDEALSAYNNAISVDKEYADAYLSRGFFYVYKKQASRACKDFKVAKNLGASSADQALSTYCK